MWLWCSGWMTKRFHRALGRLLMVWCHKYSSNGNQIKVRLELVSGFSLIFRLYTIKSLRIESLLFTNHKDMLNSSCCFTVVSMCTVFYNRYFSGCGCNYIAARQTEPSAAYFFLSFSVGGEHRLTTGPRPLWLRGDKTKMVDHKAGIRRRAPPPKLFLFSLVTVVHDWKNRCFF